MTVWMGRLGAALLSAIALTAAIWLFGAIALWLDSVIPAPVMLVVAVGIFVVAVVGDVIYDALRQRGSVYEVEREVALRRGDDEL